MKDGPLCGQARGMRPLVPTSVTGLSAKLRLYDLPDVAGPPCMPKNRRGRCLTPVVGPLRSSFSGSSWHFAEAAFGEQILDAACAMSLGPTKRNRRVYAAGVLWKAQRFLSGRKTGGFKFHPQYHDILWSQYLEAFSDSILINQIQMYGPHFRRQHAAHGIKPCFYIDGTLSEYFATYGSVNDPVVTMVGDDVQRRAITEEREDYAHAERIITMSRKSERTLRTVYGVPAERISVVLPGANIPDMAVPTPAAHLGWLGDEFTVGFVGLFPLRKGLPLLAAAVRLLRERRLPVRLRVIGDCPPEISAMDGVEFLGRLNKAVDLPRFVDALRGVDLGCQLSRAELLGIAMLEFLRLGVPFLATAVGGIPDVAAGGGGVVVASTITAEELAEVLSQLVTNSQDYQRLRQAAIQRSEWASWRRAAREFDSVLAPLG